MTAPPPPSTRPFLRAQWRDLVMRNVAVDPALLAPLVPRGTTLDLWRGEAIVSLVGFRFVDTRVLGVAVPFHRDFEEVNLRFYVRAERFGESRRGVVFIRELVPRAAIAWAARLGYNEPYRALPMRHRIVADGPTRDVRYGWKERGGWTQLRASTEGPPRPLDAGSEAEFITEHYWGYCRQRDGSTLEYQVAHPRWDVWNATACDVDGDLTATYGPALADALRQPPRSAFVAVGSAITVHRPTRL